MNTRFDHPTLVTLTAPTCAGKSYLLEALVTELGFNRLVSTTDRAPRAGEVEGVHYFFISTEQSEVNEKQGLFAELVTFNGTRYGVTHEEMAKKMVRGAPPMVILEPKGVQIYREYCAAHGWNMFSIFVDTPEEVRISRLGQRTTADICREVFRPVGIDASVIRKVIDTNNKRLQAVLTEERTWADTNSWDAVVDGTNLSRALSTICSLIEARNRINP